MRRLASLSSSFPQATSARRSLRRALGASLVALAFAAPAQAAINVNKTFEPDAVAVGQKSTVTFYFLNANTSAATSLAFTDPLPANVVVANPPNFQTTCGGSMPLVGGESSVTFSGGTVPAAAGVTPGACQLSFDVLSNTAGVYINSVPAGEVTSSQGPNGQDAEATLNVSVLNPITGSKSFSPSFVHGYLPVGGVPPAGAVSVVTITLNNVNGTSLTNVTFTDTFPLVAAGGIALAPTPNESTSCGGTVTTDAVSVPNKVTLSGGTIPAFSTCTVTFSVIAEKPLESAQGNVTNTISAGTVTTFEGVTNASFSGAVNRVTGAQIVKSFNPSSIANGGSAVMTVQVRNYNVTALNGITFTDNLPVGLVLGNPVLVTPAVATDCAFPPFAFAAAPAPGATSFTIAAGSLPAAPSGSASAAFCNLRFNVVGNNATINPITLTNGSSNIVPGTFGDNVEFRVTGASIVVTPDSPISGTKIFSPTTIFQDGTSVATIVLTNASGVALTNVSLTDALSTMGSGFTIAAYPPAAAPTSSCGGVITAVAGSGTFSLSGGSMAAGGTCTLTFPVHAADNASIGARNNDLPVGTVTATTPSAATVSNRLRIRGTLTVSAVASGSKAFLPSTVPAGTDSLLTISVTQRPGAPAWTSFSVTDPLPGTGPTQHTVSPNNPPAGTPSNACLGTLTAPSGATSIQFTGGTFPVGLTSCVIRVNVRTPSGSGGTAQNSIPAGSLVVTTAGGTFSNPGAINANITRTFGAVTMSKAFDPAVVDLLGESTMSVRIVNNASGAVNLTGLGFTDNLPSGMVVAPTPGAAFTGGAGCSGGTITAVAGASVVSVAGASVNAGKICTLEVKVKAMSAGNLINQLAAGTLSTAQGITNAEPVAATLTSTGLADLAVTKDDGVLVVTAGGTTTYTIVVTNAPGSSNVAGASFVDNPPAGMTFTSWSCVPSAGAACTANGTGPIDDTVDIPASGSLTYTVNAAIAAGYALPSITNTATITAPASAVDSNPNNNEASDTDNLVKNVVLDVTKDDGKTTYTPGSSGTYTVIVKNTGISDATSVTVTDPLPAGLTLSGTVTCVATAGSSCGTVTGVAPQTSWGTTGATLQAGGADTLTFTVPVSYGASMTAPSITNTATALDVPSGATDEGSDTNTQLARTLTLRKTWVNGAVGDQVTMTTTGLPNNATITSTSAGNDTDVGVPAANGPGDTVTLPAETFGTGSQANYTTTVACTGATPSSATPPATFTMPDADVVCTYTNTRAGRSLTLRKAWVNGKPGDKITVATSGLANDAAITSTSSATGDNIDTGSAVSNPAGATVTLPSETFDVGLQAHYTTTVSCTGATLSGVSPGATFTMPDGDVTCTYTNTRKSATLQLVNVWINAVPGDQIADAANGIANSLGVGLTSVANAANETDVGPVVTVYAGELAGLVQGVVTGSGSNYLQSFSCAGNATPLSVGNLSVSSADVAIVCTFVNQRLIPAPPTPVRPVPVNSPFGLALMAILLAMAGVFATRRRASIPGKRFRSR